MKIKKYICKFCSDKGISSIYTRQGLREHLKKEHRILREITNSLPAANTSDRHIHPEKQDWWQTEEF